MATNITTSWTFQDGREYVIYFTVFDHPSNPSMTVQVSDKITAEEWSCTYESKYIENLTHRTGNYKPFSVFTSMLKSAFLKQSESVCLDLISYEDLENKRIAVGKSGICGHNADAAFSNVDPTHGGFLFKESIPPVEKTITGSKKKYLIVTYIAEFDRVLYPIPLNHSGPPNPQVMQNNILMLKSEVASLRKAKLALEDEVELLKSSQMKRIQQLPEVLPPGESSNKQSDADDKHNENVRQTKRRHPEEHDLIHELQRQIEILEERIDADRTDHQVRLEKLQAENDFLHQKLEERLQYEEKLEEELSLWRSQFSRLTKTERLESLLRRGSTRSDLGLRRSGGTPEFGKGTIIPGRFRSPSPVLRPVRSYSSSPCKRAFDPTAYILEKRLKQEHIAQMRLDQLKSQMRSRSTSRSSSVSSVGRVEATTERRLSNPRTNPDSGPQSSKPKVASFGVSRASQAFRPPIRKGSPSPLRRKPATNLKTSNMSTKIYTHSNHQRQSRIDNNANTTKSRLSQMNDRADKLRQEIATKLSNKHVQSKLQTISTTPNANSLHIRLNKLLDKEFPEIRERLRNRSRSKN